MSAYPMQVYIFHSPVFIFVANGQRSNTLRLWHPATCYWGRKSMSHEKQIKTYLQIHHYFYGDVYNVMLMFILWRWGVLFDSPNVLCELRHMIAKMIFLKNELMNAIKFITDICKENALHCILHNLFLSLSSSFSWNILFYTGQCQAINSFICYFILIQR